MYLLSSERQKRIQEAMKTLERTGRLSIFEPCDCGSQIRHNCGGNYHSEIFLRRNSRKIFFVKFETSSMLAASAEWQECQDPKAIIKENSDWLK